MRSVMLAQHGLINPVTLILAITKTFRFRIHSHHPENVMSMFKRCLKKCFLFACSGHPGTLLCQHSLVLQGELREHHMSSLPHKGQRKHEYSTTSLHCFPKIPFPLILLQFDILSPTNTLALHLLRDDSTVVLSDLPQVLHLSPCHSYNHLLPACPQCEITFRPKNCARIRVRAECQAAQQSKVIMLLGFLGT